MFQTNHMMSRIVGKGASTVAVEHARCLSTERAFDLTLLPPAFDDHAWLLSSLEASAQKEFFFKQICFEVHNMGTQRGVIIYKIYN